MKFCLKTFLLVFVLHLTNGQDVSFPYRHYSTEHGLPNADVYAATKDRAGNIWFATNHGATRFNGTTFKNYTHHQKNYPQFATAIAAKGDSIYVGYYRAGVELILPNERRIFYPSINYPYSIQTNSRGAWIEDNSRQGSYLLEDKKIIRLPQKKTRNAPTDQEKNVYWVRGGRLFRNGKFFRHLPDVLVGKTIHCVQSFGNGELGLGTSQGLWRLTRNGQAEPIIEGISNQEVVCFVRDNRGKIWLRIGEKGYVWYANRLISLDKVVGVNDLIIRNFFYDSENQQVWLLSNGNGAFCFHNPYLKYQPINHLTKSDNVLSLKFDVKDKLWIGTADLVATLENGNANTFPTPSGYHYFRQIIANADGEMLLSPSQIDQIDNNIVSGKADRVIQGQTIHFGHAPAVFRDNHELFDSNFRLRKRSGDQFVSDSLSFVVSAKEDTLAAKFWTLQNQNRVSAYFQQGDTLWISSEIGLFWLINNQLGSVQGYPFKNPQVISSDRLGRIWIGSETGLAIWDKGEWVFSGSKTHEGVTVSSVREMVFDKKNRAWLGSPNGLICLDAQLNLLAYHNKKTGLPESEVTALEYEPKNNKIWIGTVRGLVSLETPVLHIGKPPVLRIDSVYANQKRFDPNDASLGHNENNIVVFVSAINHQNPETLCYEYSLDGGDNWVKTTKSEIELFLSDGEDYEFMIRCRAYNTAYSKPIVWEFEIKAPIYQRWWFILLCLAGLAYLWYLWLKRAEKMRAEHLTLSNQVLELKQQSLASLINPHFIFNSLNSIQYLFNSNEVKQANEYMAQLGKLIRRNLEIMNQPSVSVETEINQLELYLSLEKIRFGDKFKYLITTDNDIDKERVHIPSMVLQPFVENALLHGILPMKEPGFLHLSFQQVQDILVCKITDNGIGIKNSQQNKKRHHVSKSMQLINDRISTLNQIDAEANNKISISSPYPASSDTGTQVVIWLKVTVP